jgi:hypothetical protein
VNDPLVFLLSELREAGNKYPIGTEERAVLQDASALARIFYRAVHERAEIVAALRGAIGETVRVDRLTVRESPDDS